MNDVLNISVLCICYLHNINFYGDRNSTLRTNILKMSSSVRFVRSGQRILQQRCVRRIAQPKRNMGGAADEVYYRGEVPPHPNWWWHMSACVTAGLVLWVGLNTYRHTYHVINTDKYPVNEMVDKWTDEELGIPPDEEDVYPPGYVPLKQR